MKKVDTLSRTRQYETGRIQIENLQQVSESSALKIEQKAVKQSAWRWIWSALILLGLNLLILIKRKST